MKENPFLPPGADQKNWRAGILPRNPEPLRKPDLSPWFPPGTDLKGCKASILPRDPEPARYVPTKEQQDNQHALDNVSRIVLGLPMIAIGVLCIVAVAGAVLKPLG